jgi:mono/diheme cytochrome c family protein
MLLNRATRAALLVGTSCCLLAGSAEATDSARDSLQRQFTDRIQPLVAKYCISCHGQDAPEGKLDLSRFTTAAQIGKAHPTWDVVLERLVTKEMPPEDADEQPSDEERTAIVSWLRAWRKHEADRNAGDPGLVLVRRLNSAEYNYTIRDLTSVDIRPTREFPIDPANEAGFDNSSESLSMSPALLKKYVAAARQVADHLILKPEGFAFAPHPVQTDTDRDKYCVKQIVEFYYRQPTDYARYFLAAWHFRHRAALGWTEESLEQVAARDRVSARYLTTVWKTLEEPAEAGPLARLQAMWRELPQPDNSQPDSARPGCEAMRDVVVRLRRKLEPAVDDLDVDGIHKGAQPLVLWKNGQYASYRRAFARSAMSRPDDPDLIVPAGELAKTRFEASLAKFCSVFPDAFYISERGRDYVGKAKDEQEKGRLLSAGFHSMMGYYRDDQPLYDLVLDEREQSEIDRLWQELDFATSAPLRQYTGFVWFERTDSRFMRDPEFDFARSEDKNVTSEPMIQRLGEVYLGKARRKGADEIAVGAIENYFRDISAQIRWVEQARVAAEPSHLRSLLALAERAYRRPLAQPERDGLLAFYRSLRDSESLSHEEAIQDVLVAVLLSPNFCYRMDLAHADEARRTLTDYELASRLSYFLWSSMPDEELLARAAAGDLHQPEVLKAEARRMLRDERVRGLAVEFGGNWLDFRRFESHNSVDRQRFPSFTNELRQAMFEEPVRFFVDVAQQDRSVLQFIEGRHTFVNPILAEHYGIPLDHDTPDQWSRIDNADGYGRGGVLPMAALLTQNAPGLRTSPVKRGYWVARRLLGERIPPPPPDVPELPADESKLELSLRETLTKHRDHKSCAGCHERFDSLGLVFEGFGPIGERRNVDLGGKPVDTRATFPGGGDGQGLAGLRQYLREHRQENFLDNLCRKLLSYALGRTLLPSDDKTIEQMRSRLAADEHRFGTLVEAIVTSPQFITKRGIDSPQE